MRGVGVGQVVAGPLGCGRHVPGGGCGSCREGASVVCCHPLARADVVLHAARWPAELFHARAGDIVGGGVAGGGM